MYVYKYFCTVLLVPSFEYHLRRVSQWFSDYGSLLFLYTYALVSGVYSSLCTFPLLKRITVCNKLLVLLVGI